MKTKFLQSNYRPLLKTKSILFENTKKHVPMKVGNITQQSKSGIVKTILC